MVGSIERIEQDIVALNQATQAMAEAFYNAYSAYLSVLGTSVRQQIILASYHVCTQGYPEAFLQLSYSQRHHLQQMLRHLAQQVQEEILAQLHMPVVFEETREDAEREPLSLEPAAPATDAPDALEPVPIATTQATTQPLTPMHLARWREELEHAIVAELRTASHAANRLLQQAGILPQKLPEPVLEAATKAEIPEARAGTPNLLNLLIETRSGNAAAAEAPDDTQEPSVMHIVAIYLRLTEIEFADPTIAAARSKIRSLFAQLKTLGREYQKRQHERSIAAAQAAWRSSWTEE